MGDTSNNTELKIRKVILSSVRRPKILCTPDGGSVLKKFRKNHQKPLDGFILTVGIIISVTIQGSRVLDLTANFSTIDEPVTGPYNEFRLDPDDKTELLEALRRATKTEIRF